MIKPLLIVRAPRIIPGHPVSRDYTRFAHAKKGFIPGLEHGECISSSEGKINSLSGAAKLARGEQPPQIRVRPRPLENKGARCLPVLRGVQEVEEVRSSRYDGVVW